MGVQLVTLSIVFALFATIVVDARKPRLLDPVAHTRMTSRARSADDPPCQNYNCKVGWLSGVPINHSEPNDRQTFEMQYLYNLDNYDRSANGPLFFYTGNEGAIEEFADNTGIMWDLAKQFRAAIVFAEHRFYGMSMPFKNPWTQATSSVDGIEKLSTMDVRQVIEDYAFAIPRLKVALKLPPNTPVIAFGGSYGGMITAWLALKHPNLLAGAWSASAPLIYFKGSGLDIGAYNAIAKRTFLAAGCDEVAILYGFSAISRLSQSVLGRKILEKVFNVDTTRSPLKTAYDAEGLEGWVREAFEYMAMTDYPYPSNFLKPLPGWPVTEACKFLKSPPANLSDYVTLASQLANASLVYYGNDKKHCVVAGCGDDATSGLDGGRVSDPKAYLAWTYQACTQMTVYSCAQGPPNDLFWKDCDADQFTREMEEGCGYWLSEIKGYVGSDRFFKTYFVRDEYGYNLTSLRNVIFTNGNLDPWSGGGITTQHLAADATANGVYVYNIDGAAHHLDLRGPNTCDPEPVKAARYQIVGILQCWLGLRPEAECADATKLQLDLPPFSQKQSVNCSPDTSGYPWGLNGNGYATGKSVHKV